MVIEEKEKENLALLEDVKTIENRWKNHAKEAHKHSTRHILAALELKSMNEMSAHMIRAARNTARA